MLENGKRAVIAAFGETPLDAIDHHLVFEEQPPPDPAKLGPLDAIVRVRSASVGWVDLMMSSGHYQHSAKPPYCPGLEYSGDVIWVGAEVRNVSVGDAVLADGLLTGPRSLGAYQSYGGYATYAVAPAEALIPLPSRFDYDQGCNLLGNYETAYHCLITCGGLCAGETVLINGASGATGVAAVHVAKLVGATVIATGRSLEKLEHVRAEGADHVVQVTDNLRDDVRAITGDGGVDVVYDGVGGELSVQSLRCLRFGGRFLIVGWASTPFVAKSKGQRGAPNANVLPTNLILMKGLHVIGCPTAISSHRDPSLRAPRLRQLLKWVEAGKITPRVSQVFGMSELGAAMRAKWESRAVGGIVVHPES